MKEEMFEGSAGIALFARSFRPELPVRGSLVIVHGFKSHSGLYDWAARQFVERGIAVYALDLRGHGKSDGDRFFVDSFGDYVSDVSRFVTLVKKREPGVPTFMLGHGAGGVIACIYALEHQTELRGLICESFAHEVPAPDFALAVLKGLSLVAPHAHVLNLKDEDFSRDAAFVERMKNDPLIVHTPGATQTLAEMVRADERLKREFGSIVLPLLILHGTGDRAAKAHNSQLFFEQAGSTDKTLRLYEGHYHDLLNDLDKERVMADIVGWLEPRLVKL